MKWLKRIRVIIAVFFFFSISSLFLDYRNIIPAAVYSFFTSTQVIPSLIHTIISFSLVSIGLLFVLILTLFYGRVYCSAICPLGILQDFIIRLSKRVNRRRRFKFKKPYYSIHYILFGVSTILILSGSVFLLNLFEPFSNYGRILTNLINPSIVLANNLLAKTPGSFVETFLYQVPIIHISTISLIVPFIFLLLILYLSYYHGRLYCNLLCPAGALLGLLTRLSIYKIVIEENKCIECGLCERVCKANCINSDSKEIDFAACVGCFNCVKVCSTSGVVYKRRLLKASTGTVKVDGNRRILLKSSLLPVIGMLIPEIVKSEIKIGNAPYKDRDLPISPPGSIAIERFSNLCTACHVCISCCPTQVLYPSFLEYGVSGILQPRMNYSVSYCNFDCVVCSQVCPSGAILPINSEEKKMIQIGQARFVKENCVVITNERDCGACSEHCPTKAVYMVPYGDLSLPEVNDEICIGCGACEHACPAEPNKAIFVITNRTHQKAKKPKPKRPAPSFDDSQDFPF